MAWDLTVILEDKPGTLAELGETLGKEGINIHGGFGMPCEGRGVIHVLVDDPDAATAALADAGITAHTPRPVYTHKFQDRPGELGDQARKMANAGINVDLFYLTAAGELVLGVSDIDKARSL